MIEGASDRVSLQAAAVTTTSTIVRLSSPRVRKELATDMIIKSPLLGSDALLRKVQKALGPDWLPLLIAIDGADGIGKSSLASWLAWQLGAPAIYLDLYVIRGSWYFTSKQTTSVHSVFIG
jgi:pantothenate kinase-related protein Tda10